MVPSTSVQVPTEISPNVVPGMSATDTGKNDTVVGKLTEILSTPTARTPAGRP
ncbi:hypothetical protein RE474_05835 [Methanolobus sediminis]|uniref:Uncharacterized protein n=1 Tax=Methanolobus sediminis TaxID=3072978 RepID=A0AA51YK55_9EURY|nr:hypothetical protein [Methanolobus sediminis]WMW26230.1 hypothetical protein RE474_05835 [Methanolobus sediminis]